MSNTPAIPLTAKRTDIFTPPALECEDDKPGEKEVSFEIRIPTPSERDTIGTRLFEIGLTAVSQETVRATLIDELYKIDWMAHPDALEDDWRAKFEEAVDGRANGVSVAAALRPLYDAYADEIAEFLDGFWTRQAVDEMASSEWIERERQRVLDEMDGAPAIKPYQQPRGTVRPREQARAKLIVDQVMERSERLRKLAARQLDYGRQNALMMARLHILSIMPADPKAFAKVPGGLEAIKLERDKNKIVTEDSMDRLREFIGPRAWAELGARIESHYSLSEDERKNSDLPAGKPSDPTGSHELNGGSGNNNGSSTGSDTALAPTAESGTTTAKSSG